MLNPFQKSKLSLSKSFQNKPFVRPSFDIERAYIHLTGNRVKRSGRALLCLCPIHGDRLPSLALYPDTNSYFCFSCSESGDAINLAMKIRECDYKEAVEELKRV